MARALCFFGIMASAAVAFFAAVALVIYAGMQVWPLI